MKTLNLFVLFLFASIIVSAQTWEDIAKLRSESEVKQAKKVLVSTAYNLTYIKQLTVIESIDIEKTIANTYIMESISPNTKIFKGKSFIDIMKESVKKNFSMKSKFGDSTLAAGLDNATNSNGLLTSLINVHPIGEAVGNVLSVVNGFLEKKGVFLFIKKLFAPNYEKQIKNFQKDLTPYITFYNSLDEYIEKSRNTYITFQSILISDGKKLNDLFLKYETSRNKLMGDKNHTKDDFIEYVNNIPSNDLTASQYSQFIKNEELQELIFLSKQIKETEINMSYNYLAFNKTAIESIEGWKNLLDTSFVTSKNKSKDLKDIVIALNYATQTISTQITTLETIINEQRMDKKTEWSKKIMKMRMEENFFAPTMEYQNLIKKNNPTIKMFLEK